MTDAGLNLGGRALLSSYHASLCHPLIPGTTVPSFQLFSASSWLLLFLLFLCPQNHKAPQALPSRVLKWTLLPGEKNRSLQVAVRKQKCGNLICTKLIWLMQHVIALHFLVARVCSNLRWFLKFIWRPNECTAALSGKASPALTADFSPSQKGYVFLEQWLLTTSYTFHCKGNWGTD